MKSLVEKINEGFFKNTGTGLHAEIQELFSVGSLGKYFDLTPTNKLKYLKEKKVLLDVLPAGTDISIKIHSDVDYECREYIIRKTGEDTYKKNMISSWTKGRFTIDMDADSVLRLVLGDISARTGPAPVDPRISITTTITK